MRMHDCNWMQIERYLDSDDRIVLPLGSTEQHGYLSLGTDAILAERIAVEAAEPLGVPVLPAMPVGLAPYFAAYPGSPSLRATTYLQLVGRHERLWLGQLDALEPRPGQVLHPVGVGTFGIDPLHHLPRARAPPPVVPHHLAIRIRGHPLRRKARRGRVAAVAVHE